jgi:hypothetical protein
MLNPIAFTEGSQALNLRPAALEQIQAIRSSEPVRHVRSRGSNVRAHYGRYQRSHFAEPSPLPECKSRHLNHNPAETAVFWFESQTHNLHLGVTFQIRR